MTPFGVALWGQKKAVCGQWRDFFFCDSRVARITRMLKYRQYHFNDFI